MEGQVKISRDLFFKLCAYHLANIDDDEESIKIALSNKLDSLVKHELYSTYKTADTEAEREQARQEYLDKIGVLEAFRW